MKTKAKSTKVPVRSDILWRKKKLNATEKFYTNIVIWLTLACECARVTWVGF